MDFREQRMDFLRSGASLCSSGLVLIKGLCEGLSFTGLEVGGGGVGWILLEAHHEEVY